MGDQARNQGRGNTDGAYSCTAVVLADHQVGGLVDLVDVVGSWSVALEVDADGGIEFILADDTVSVTRPFKAGVERPMVAKTLVVAGTDAATVYVYR